jgi:hypothetical protein
MAPPPKPPGQRVRRNLDQKKWKTLPAARPFKLPAVPRGWSATTRNWWKLIWESPMAAVWLESDVPALLRLGNLLELQTKGKISAIMVGEIRQIEDRFGLSPKSRHMLQWYIPQEAGDGTGDLQDDLQPRRQRHLKAV